MGRLRRGLYGSYQLPIVQVRQEAALETQLKPDKARARLSRVFRKLSGDSVRTARAPFVVSDKIAKALEL